MHITHLNNTAYTFDTLTPFNFTADITGYAGGGGWQLLVPDINIAHCSNATGASVSGTAMQFILEQDIANALLYETSAASTTGGAVFTIQPRELGEERTMTLTFIHVATGAWASAQVTVKANKDTRRRVSGTSRG